MRSNWLYLAMRSERASEPVTPEWYARKATFFARMRWRVAYWLSLADYRVSRLGTG